MKKTLTIIMLIILSIAVVAQSTNSELKELNSFQNDKGAELRFLQLSETIQRNMDHGELIIEKILESDSEADVSRLNEILGEYQDLIDEIDAVDYEQSIEDLIDLYLEIKESAKELSAEFKEISKEYLSEELKLELKNQFKEMTKVSSQVKNMINQYNAEQAKKIMNMLGKEDDLSEKIENGQMSKNQIMSQLSSEYKGLETEKQNQAMFKMQEQKAVMQVASNQFMQQYQQKKQMNDGNSENNQGQQGSNENNQNQGNEDTGMNQGDNDNGSNGGNENSGSDNSGSDSSGGSSGGSDSSGGNNGGDSGGSTGGTSGGNGGGRG